MMPRMPRTEANGLRAFIRSLPKLWGGNAQLTFFQNYSITFLPLEGFLAPFHRFFHNAAHSVTRLGIPLFLAVLLPIGELKGLEDTYWQGYLDARRVGQVSNVMTYLSQLATPSRTETPEALRQRKDALTYFMATGGKYGFSDKKATPEEIEDWHKAFTFVALMQETLDPNVSLNFVEMRRRFGRNEEDERVSTHLRLAQEWVTSTRMRACQYSPQASTKIDTLFHREYMHLVGSLLGYPRTQVAWLVTLNGLIQSYTDKQEVRITQLHDSWQKAHLGTTRLGPLQASSKPTGMEGLGAFIRSCCQPIAHVRLANGLVVTRNIAGQVALKRQGGRGMRIPQKASKALTEEAFVAALGEWSAVKEFFYA